MPLPLAAEMARRCLLPSGENTEKRCGVPVLIEGAHQTRKKVGPIMMLVASLDCSPVCIDSIGVPSFRSGRAQSAQPEHVTRISNYAEADKRRRRCKATWDHEGLKLVARVNSLQLSLPKKTS